MENKKKKIGLVIKFIDTQNNYGSSLVNFAMLQQLLRMGYDVEVIQYRKDVPFIRKLWMLWQMFRIGAYDDKFRDFRAKIGMKLHRKAVANIAVRTAAVTQFKDAKIAPYVRIYTGFENLCRGAFNYDAIVVGSDQLWTPMSLYNRFYNLLFVDTTIPKISYGTSFGVSKIHKLQEKQFGEFLDRFSNISVRELSGKKIVETISHSTAQVVCDPTLLFTRDEWAKEIIQSTAKTSEPYIFCYLLGKNDETRKTINELKQKTGLKIITIRHTDEYIATDEQFGDEAPYDVSPLDFVKYISEAQYVCTDSFHGTIFSILFHRKFMTFYRYSTQSKESRNSRIDSLCGLLGLEHRIFNGNIDAITQDIPYNEVDTRLEKLRGESVAYLTESLSKAVG